MVRPDDGRSIPSGKFGRNLARDFTWLFVPRSDRAPERIDQPPLYFVDHLFRKVLEFQDAGVVGELVSECFGHLFKIESSICRRILRRQLWGKRVKERRLLAVELKNDGWEAVTP